MLKNIITRIINTACIIIIILAILVLCMVMFDKSGNGIMGYYSYRVATGSMEPTIKIDSLIVVRGCENPEALSEGEIISFYSRDPQLGGSVNTHRIEAVNVHEDGSVTYTTRGDANYISDEYEVEPGDIIGTVVFVSYFLGVITRLVSNPIVFIPLVAIPLIAILVINIRNTLILSATIKQEEEEQALRLALEEVRRQKALKEAQKEAQKETESQEQSDEQNIQKEIEPEAQHEANDDFEASQKDDR